MRKVLDHETHPFINPFNVHLAVVGEPIGSIPTNKDSCGLCLHGTYISHVQGPIRASSRRLDPDRSL